MKIEDVEKADNLIRKLKKVEFIMDVKTRLIVILCHGISQVWKNVKNVEVIC